jgi:putative colanic acid biosynthesis acetyltransferase WcaF
VQLWRFCDFLLFKSSPQFMYGWRRFLLRFFGAKIGKKVLIRSSVQIIYPWKLSIGDYSWIGESVILYCLGPISIGSNTVISQQSHLCAGSHDYLSPTFDQIAIGISINSEVWIAADVFIVDGVSVGRGAVVGARSSVFKSLPELSFSFGNPASIKWFRENSFND